MYAAWIYEDYTRRKIRKDIEEVKLLKFPIQELIIKRRQVQCVYAMQEEKEG